VNVFAVQRIETARRIGVLAHLGENLAELARGMDAVGAPTVVHIGPVALPAAAALEAEQRQQCIYIVDGTQRDLDDLTWFAPNAAIIGQGLSTIHALGHELIFGDDDLGPCAVIRAPDLSAGALLSLDPGERAVVDCGAMKIDRLP
jgi:hypothetical protein